MAEKIKKKAMTTAERQRKYMQKPENKEKHRQRMILYNEKMRQARLFARQHNQWQV